MVARCLRASDILSEIPEFEFVRCRRHVGFLGQ